MADEKSPAPPRVYLSVPHMSGRELDFVRDAFESNWLSSVGPHLDGFEAEIAERLGGGLDTLAVSSGTAALHLVLREIGVGPGDRVAVSTLTFAGSVFPILYCGGIPVFLDSDAASMNMDPALVAQYLSDAAKRNQLPKVLIAVHLYGQHADLDPIAAACAEHGVVLVEDAAESLGGTYRGRQTATTADYGILSFNGNKIITTTGGGMVVARKANAISRMRKWANQSRDAAIEYLHSEIGYNYRMSNVLAAIGRGQLTVLDDRVAARRRIAARYGAAFGAETGVSIAPEMSWGSHTRWLSVLQFEPQRFGSRRTESVPRQLVAQLRPAGIELRPVWRPMHTQPVFADCEAVGGATAEALYANGVCLPSSSSLAEADQDEVIARIHACLSRAED